MWKSNKEDFFVSYKVLTSPYNVVESIFQTAIGYSPVVQVFCTVIKRSASSCHVTNLHLAAINNKMHTDYHTETNKQKLYIKKICLYVKHYRKNNISHLSACLQLDGIHNKEIK